MWETVFVIGAAFVTYTYLVYPALLLAGGKLRPRRRGASTERVPLGKMSSVSVVVAARNEEGRIGRRIANLLEADYPRDRIEIIVVCDGCTDGTADEARAYPGAIVIEREVGEGKAAALNVGIAAAQNDIIVLTDARTVFEPSAIAQLVQDLQDPKVGAVSGELVLLGDDDRPKALGLYWKYERVVRKLECGFSSVVGCSGSIYAIRRELFTPMPVGLVLDDVWVPMHISRQGYRVTFEPKATAYDRVADSYSTEFGRKVRTLGGNYQLFWWAPWMLVPWLNRIWWQTMSHKLARLLVPFALIAMFAASWMLVYTTWGFAATMAQCLFYAVGAAAWADPRLAKTYRLAGFAGTFLSLNTAAVAGLIAFIRGRGRVQWGRSGITALQQHDATSDAASCDPTTQERLS